MAKGKVPPALRANAQRLKKGEPLKTKTGLGQKPKNVSKRKKKG